MVGDVEGDCVYDNQNALTDSHAQLLWLEMCGGFLSDLIKKAANGNGANTSSRFGNNNQEGSKERTLQRDAEKIYKHVKGLVTERGGSAVQHVQKIF